MYNTGRDTYLLPVNLEDGWPEILAKNTPISTVGEKAGLKPAAKNEFSGNFSYVDNFEADNNKAGLKELNPRWMFLRDFVDCYKVENGKLKFNLLPGNIYKREPMSAIWHVSSTAPSQLRQKSTYSSQRQGYRRLGTSPEGRPQFRIG